MPLAEDARSDRIRAVDVLADDRDQDVPVACVHLITFSGPAGPSQGSAGYNAGVSSVSPAIDPSIASLLGRVWPSLPGVATRAGALGFPWAAVSTPFVRREGGRVVGHVGVIDLPLVLAGHDHDYQRSEPVEGVTYVVSGGGGASIRPTGTADFTSVSVSTTHFLDLLVYDDRLVARAIDASGSLVDRFTLTR